MSNTEERRTYPRQATRLQFKVYTSITNAGYTVDVTDISKKGAFIRHRFMPQVGEVINFEVLDEYYRMIEAGTAKVKWINTSTGTGRENWGYGIEFDQELTVTI